MSPRRASARATIASLRAALYTIATYTLPVYTIEQHGQHAQMVPLDNAEDLRTLARKALNLQPEK